MLVVPPDSRITVKEVITPSGGLVNHSPYRVSSQALTHDFILGARSDTLMVEALKNLKSFNAKRKFKVMSALRVHTVCNLELYWVYTGGCDGHLPRLQIQSVNNLEDHSVHSEAYVLMCHPSPKSCLILACGLTHSDSRGAGVDGEGVQEVCD